MQASEERITSAAGAIATVGVASAITPPIWFSPADRVISDQLGNARAVSCKSAIWLELTGGAALAALSSGPDAKEHPVPANPDDPDQYSRAL